MTRWWLSLLIARREAPGHTVIAFHNSFLSLWYLHNYIWWRRHQAPYYTFFPSLHVWYEKRLTEILPGWTACQYFDIAKKSCHISMLDIDIGAALVRLLAFHSIAITDMRFWRTWRRVDDRRWYCHFQVREYIANIMILLRFRRRRYARPLKARIILKCHAHKSLYI